jgi:hypothetical protein
MSLVGPEIQADLNILNFCPSSTCVPNIKDVLIDLTNL